MIRKLQLRFTLLTMSALFLVLGVIVAGINLFNYHSIIQEADQLLQILAENNGRFPQGASVLYPDEDGEEDADDLLSLYESPEVRYETRYFSVVLSRSGSVVQTNTDRIAAISDEAAIALAQQAAARSGQTGMLGDYRYRKAAFDSWSRIIFLDCGRRMDVFRDFLFFSCLVSLFGCLLVTALFAVFSARIVRPMAESYEKQKQFITDAGHEIKTPLSIIVADTDVLEMELGKNEWITDIQKQARRLSELTNKLVYLTRMEESGGAVVMIDFPVSDIVEEAAAPFRTLAALQHKNFQLWIVPMLSMTGDEKSFFQLVTILLDNALKYSPEGGDIALTLDTQSHALRLCVTNTTAAPVSEDMLSRLFDRFYRGDPSRSSAAGGHGIGLSIAKAVTAAHGGKIQATLPKKDVLQITAVFPR